MSLQDDSELRSPKSEATAVQLSSHFVILCLHLHNVSAKCFIIISLVIHLLNCIAFNSIRNSDFKFKFPLPQVLIQKTFFFFFNRWKHFQIFEPHPISSDCFWSIEGKTFRTGGSGGLVLRSNLEWQRTLAHHLETGGAPG